jgi:hypothetical protein
MMGEWDATAACITGSSSDSFGFVQERNVKAGDT